MVPIKALAATASARRYPKQTAFTFERPLWLQSNKLWLFIEDNVTFVADFDVCQSFFGDSLYLIEEEMLVRPRRSS